jgi:predicted NBD/HSP70 family sugar kinase
VLVNVFAPSLIVLSGEGLRAPELLLDAAGPELRRLAFGDLAERVELAVEPWGDDAWARGAAALAASRYLTDQAMSARGV